MTSLRALSILRQVEDHIYKLPKCNLQHSSFFSDLFGPPKVEGVDNKVTGQSNSRKSLIGVCGEGESDQNPIILRGITKDTFDSFLRVLYPT